MFAISAVMAFNNTNGRRHTYINRKIQIRKPVLLPCMNLLHAMIPYSGSPGLSANIRERRRVLSCSALEMAFRSKFRVRSGDAVVGVTPREQPFQVFPDLVIVITGLCREGVLQPPGLHRNAGVVGDAIPGRQDRPCRLNFCYCIHDFILYKNLLGGSISLRTRGQSACSEIGKGILFTNLCGMVIRAADAS